MVSQRVIFFTGLLVIAALNNAEGREGVAGDGHGGGMLDRTVITATRSQSDLLDSPVTLSVLGREEIERRPAAGIAELFRHSPGVMIMRMMGLSSCAALKRMIS